MLLPAFLMACTPDLTDSEHVVRARDYQEQGDLRAAVIELKSALRKNPENAEARSLLGELYMREGKGAAAEKELRWAQNLGVSKVFLSPLLAEALALQNKYQELLDEVEIIPEMTPEQQAKLLVYRGNAWLALGKLDKAEFEYRRALEIVPDSPLAKLGLAKLAFVKGDMDTAEELADKALEMAPQEGQLWRFKAKLAEYGNKLDESEKFYTEAIKYNRLNASDVLDRAWVRIRLKKYEAAKKDLERIQAIGEHYPQFWFVSGLLKLKQGDSEGAEADFDKAVSKGLNNPFLHYYYGLALYKNKKIAQAETELTHFLARYPDSVLARKLLAAINFELGAFKRAKVVLYPVVLLKADDPFVLGLMARIESALGNKKEEREYLKRLATVIPDTMEAKLFLGQSLLSSGEFEEGIEAIQQAVEIAPEKLMPKAQLITAHMQAGELQKAEDLARELLQDYPESSLPLNFLGAVNLLKGNYEEALRWFERARAKNSKDLSVALNMAQLYLELGKLHEAEALFKEALKDEKFAYRARMGLAELQLKRGDSAGYRAALESIVKDYPGNLKATLRLSRHYVAIGDYAGAQEVLTAGLNEHPHNLVLLAALTDAQILAGELEQSKDTLKKLRDWVPDTPLVEFYQAKIEYSSGNYGKARDIYEGLMSEGIELVPVYIDLARIYLAENQLDKAQKMVGKVSSLRPDDPQVKALAGHLAFKRKNWPKAIEYYEAALDGVDDSQWTIRLSRAYLFSGNPDAAERVLAEWLRRHERDSVVRYVYASLLSHLGKRVEAIAQFQRLVEWFPNYGIALNDLAWLLKEEDRKRALEYAQKAVESAPNNGVFRDTYGWLLYLNGDLDKALQEIRKSVALQGRDPSVLYHMAAILHARGDSKSAKEILQEVLAKEQDFDGRPQALALLREIAAR